MTSRRLVYETLEFNRPIKIPRHLWCLPWAMDHHGRELATIQERYPDDIVTAPRLGSPLPQDPPERYVKGVYVDEWGCIFENAQAGTIGLVRRPRIETWADLDGLEVPEGLLGLDKEAIDRFCQEESRFVLAGTWVRPFERLQFLRTPENLFLDLAEKPSELFELLDRVHAFYMKEVEAWARTDVDALAVMDDWGTQKSLIVSPALWRQMFKPLYKEYFDLAHAYGKKVFMHSDGYILDIIPDLIELGLDALNSQVFCMGLDRLERFRGSLTFWGEVDRQHLLAFGTREDVDRAVRSVFDRLYAAGGVIAQCEFGVGARPENVEQVFASWAEVEKRLRS